MTTTLTHAVGACPSMTFRFWAVDASMTQALPRLAPALESESGTRKVRRLGLWLVSGKGPLWVPADIETGAGDRDGPAGPRSARTGKSLGVVYGSSQAHTFEGEVVAP
jgi:hypothetical protein